MAEVFVFVSKKSRKLKVAVGRSQPRMTLEGFQKPGSMIFAQFENYEFKTTDKKVAESLVANSSYGRQYTLVSDESTAALGLGEAGSKLIAADEKRARTVKSTALKTMISDENQDHIDQGDLDNEENEALKLKEYKKNTGIIYSSKKGDVFGVVVEDIGSKVRIRRDDTNKIVRVSKAKVRINPDTKAPD